MRRLAIFLSAALAIFWLARPVDADVRGLLWRVVQTCLATHALTGGAFPCLAVDLEGGLERGYAVLRAPFEDTHIIVTPTVRTLGIETRRLRGPEAPNYFRDAWNARRFVTDDLRRKPAREDLALAVNSRFGRSQDQLHIHVDCLRPDVKRSLARQRDAIRTTGWTRLAVLPQAPRYYAMALASRDLEHVNLFDAAAAGLKIEDADDMDTATIVVVGARDVDGAPGFIVLARQRIPETSDLAHGEALLDHACASFR